MRTGVQGERELLRVEQVAAELGIHRSTVFEMLRRGELPVLRIGRLVRIPRKALDAWIEERTELPEAMSGGGDSGRDGPRTPWQR